MVEKISGCYLSLPTDSGTPETAPATSIQASIWGIVFYLAAVAVADSYCPVNAL